MPISSESYDITECVKQFSSWSGRKIHLPCPDFLFQSTKHALTHLLHRLVADAKKSLGDWERRKNPLSFSFILNLHFLFLIPVMDLRMQLGM